MKSSVIFLEKKLESQNIPIKAAAEVSDKALARARTILAMMLNNMPDVIANLRDEGAELHIIGGRMSFSFCANARNCRTCESPKERAYRRDI